MSFPNEVIFPSHYTESHFGDGGEEASSDQKVLVDDTIYGGIGYGNLNSGSGNEVVGLGDTGYIPTGYLQRQSPPLQRQSPPLPMQQDAISNASSHSSGGRKRRHLTPVDEIGGGVPEKKIRSEEYVTLKNMMKASKAATDRALSKMKKSFEEQSRQWSTDNTQLQTIVQQTILDRGNLFIALNQIINEFSKTQEQVSDLSTELATCITHISQQHPKSKDLKKLLNKYEAKLEELSSGMKNIKDQFDAINANKRQPNLPIPVSKYTADGKPKTEEKIRKEKRIALNERRRITSKEKREEKMKVLDLLHQSLDLHDLCTPEDNKHFKTEQEKFLAAERSIELAAEEKRLKDEAKAKAKAMKEAAKKEAAKKEAAKEAAKKEAAKEAAKVAAKKSTDVVKVVAKAEASTAKVEASKVVVKADASKVAAKAEASKKEDVKTDAKEKAKEEKPLVTKPKKLEKKIELNQSEKQKELETLYRNIYPANIKQVKQETVSTSPTKINYVSSSDDSDYDDDDDDDDDVDLFDSSREEVESSDDERSQ